MSIEKRLVANTGYLLFSSVLDKIFFVVFLGYAARVLGPDNFGVYCLIGTFSFFFSLITNFGLVPLSIRKIAINKEKAEFLFNHVLTIRILLIPLAFGVIYTGVYLFGYDQRVREFICLGFIAAAFGTFTFSYYSLFIAFERMVIPSCFNVLSSFLHSIMGIIVLYMGYELIGIIVVDILLAFLAAIFFAILTSKIYFGFRFKFNWPIWIDLVKQAAPFFMLISIEQVDKHLIIILLSKVPGPYSGKTALGYYYTATSTSQVVEVMTNSFRQAILPTISTNRDERNVIAKIIDRSTYFILFFISIPLIISTSFFAEEIITLVFGKDYLKAVPAFTIFGWAFALRSLNIAVAVTLSSSRKISRFVPWSFSASVLGVLLAIPLIYYLSFIGAAWAILIIVIYRTSSMYYLLGRIWHISLTDFSICKKGLLPCTLILLGGYFLHIFILNWIFLLIGNIILYGIMLFSFKIIGRQEIVFLKSMLSRG